MTRLPTLSIGIPNYNHAAFIPQCLGAILGQSVRPKEIIIIDDASTDNSVEVLEVFRRQHPQLIKVHRHHRNQGVTRTLQELLMTATGDYFFAPACDDRILPGFFERSLSLLGAHRGSGLSSTLSRVMNQEGVNQGLALMPVVSWRDRYFDPHETLRQLRKHGNWFMGNTTIYRRQALIDVGGYRDQLGPYCDGFATLVLALAHGVCFVPAPLVTWRRMDDTYSQRASAQLDNVLAFLTEAENSMRTEFKELFPADYIDEWKSEMYFGAARYAIQTRLEDFESVDRLMKPHKVIDDIYFRLAGRYPDAARSMAKPYLFARFRSSHSFQMIERRLANALLSFWYRN